MPETVSSFDLNSILAAHHADPFSVLGMHHANDTFLVRVFRPDALELAVVAAGDSGLVYPAEKIHRDGFFEATLPGVSTRFDYRLKITSPDGRESLEADPYSFGQLLSPYDLHLFAEGNHFDVYRKLGAHFREIGGVRGTCFTVWAPNAQRVSVVGDFNRWDGRVHPMRRLHGSGVWEIFLPDVGPGAHYKFELRASNGELLLKTDPFAFFSQHSVETASMVYDMDQFQWSDDDWMEQRAGKE